MKKLFTERQGQGLPRVKEELDDDSRTALWGLLATRIEDEWFGYIFNDKCGDGYAYAGTDLQRLRLTMEGYRLLWPPKQIKAEPPAPDGQVFDALEFAFEHVAEPKDPSYHRYGGHSHYSYDQETGREKFQHDVNRIFERHGLAFELVNGEVTRMAPAVLHTALAETVFATGDAELDKLLKTACEKFLNRSLDVRKEGLEKLWDAWERLKTVEPGQDKRTQAAAILDKAATEPVLRERLELEAKELNFIGNNLMIRHMETNKPPIQDSAQVDYLFHRMFSLVRLLLKASGRGE